MAHSAKRLAREREAKAWDLTLKGTKQADIAAELGVTQQAVSLMLERVERKLFAELESTVTRHKARQTARLEHIYREAMAGWDRSQQPVKKSRQRTSSNLIAANSQAAVPTEIKQETSEETVVPIGDFRFLETARAALADQRRIWGLDAPKQIRLDDRRRPLEDLSDEELQRREAENAALLDAAKAGPGAVH